MRERNFEGVVVWAFFCWNDLEDDAGDGDAMFSGWI